MNFRTFETTLHRIRKGIKSKTISNNSDSKLTSDSRIKNETNVSNNEDAFINKKPVKSVTNSEVGNSKIYFTPKHIRGIREKVINELDNEVLEDCE